MHLFHLISQPEWQQVRARGSIHPAEGERFIHCATREQVVPVANALFRERGDLLVLCVDTEQLDAHIAWEAPDPSLPAVPGLGPDPKMPHVYGTIPAEAVIEARRLTPGPEGTFVFPEAPDRA